MTKAKNTDQTIEALLNGYPPELAALICKLRTVIMHAAPGDIAEQVKWNAPAYYYTGVLPDYDAKSYRKDLLVIHTRKGYPMLIFPNGALLSDTEQILEGSYTDGRRMMHIRHEKELELKTQGLQKVLQQLITLLRTA